MDDFCISFNLYGEYGNFEKWAQAQDEIEDLEKTLNDKKRHKELTPAELDKIEDDKDEVNTKKTTKWAVNTFSDFLRQRQNNCDVETYSASLLNETLREFYASVQSTAGREYSVASLMCLRAGINRHITKYNIISDKDFKSSNAVFKSVLKRYRKNGKDTSVHHPRITESDLEKIRNAPALSPFTPTGLVRKVWFDIQLCFARRGREGNRNLSKESFVLRQDENGKEYLTLAHNPETKNHKDPTASDRENLRGFMFASPGDPLCPVDSFKKYLSKCPENAGAFYLHPRRIPLCKLESTEVWFTREPMGLNYLGNMLKNICEEVDNRYFVFAHEFKLCLYYFPNLNCIL